MFPQKDMIILATLIACIVAAAYLYTELNKSKVTINRLTTEKMQAMQVAAAAAKTVEPPPKAPPAEEDEEE